MLNLPRNSRTFLTRLFCAGKLRGGRETSTGLGFVLYLKSLGLKFPSQADFVGISIHMHAVMQYNSFEYKDNWRAHSFIFHTQISKHQFMIPFYTTLP